MKIGPAEAERADRGSPRRVCGQVPRLRLELEAKRRAVELQQGVGGFDIDRRRQLAVAQCVGHLDEARGSRRGLEVADHRLHAAEADRADRDWRVVFVVHLTQALDLGGVAHRRAGAVRFDERHRARRDAGVLVRAPHRVLLTARVRRRDSLAAAVARPADPADQRVDLVAVFDRVSEPLQDQDPGAFAHHEPVRASVERTAPVRRQRADLRELHVRRRPHRAVGTAGDDHVELPRAQPVDRRLERGERRGARGVAYVVGPAQVERLRDATGDDVGELARHRVFVDADDVVFDLTRDGGEHLLDFVVAEAPRGEVEQRRAHRDVELRVLDAQIGGVAQVAAERVAEDHRGAVAVELAVDVAGVGQRLAHRFEAEELGRVDLLHHRRWHSKRLAVEREVRHPSTDLAVRLVGGVGVGIPVDRRVPAVDRHVGDRVDAVLDVLPERRSAECSRHLRTDADNRDRGLAVEDRISGHQISVHMGQVSGHSRPAGGRLPTVGYLHLHSAVRHQNLRVRTTALPKNRRPKTGSSVSRRRLVSDYSPRGSSSSADRAKQGLAREKNDCSVAEW